MLAAYPCVARMNVFLPTFQRSRYYNLIDLTCRCMPLVDQSIDEVSWRSSIISAWHQPEIIWMENNQGSKRFNHRSVMAHSSQCRDTALTPNFVMLGTLGLSRLADEGINCASCSWASLGLYIARMCGYSHK